MDKIALIAEVSSLRAKLQKVLEEEQVLHGMILSLSARVEIQAEMLGRSAEARGHTAERVQELEAALAPFAAVLANGWDDGRLAGESPYPVPMAALRQAAKVLAGTNYKKAA